MEVGSGGVGVGVEGVVVGVASTAEVRLVTCEGGSAVILVLALERTTPSVGETAITLVGVGPVE